MSSTLGRLLIGWNILLTGLLAWALLRTPAVDAGNEDDGTVEEVVLPPRERDTTALQDARIAYFFMDSLRSGLDLLKERSEQYRKEGQRLEGNWRAEYAKAQARYEELMKKDHTYSTQAELKADQQELEGLERRIAELKQSSEERMARMETDMLREISSEVEGFLKEYNETASFDYIISVEPGGQVWVGNPDLNVTEDILNGLNARYRAKKKPTK
ncbi:MAG: OmpH family outer membrane protein [Flavobacteriales bacterium]|nr:OmpH family outer membrane protein [Flavobacteriales bacterium]